MTAHPAPMVPAEVDLRDFGFMPLDVRTLLTSSLNPSGSGATVIG